MSNVDDKKFGSAVDNMVKSFLHEEEGDYNRSLEPWEVYCERKKHLMDQKVEVFKNRFKNGYKDLLQEIKKG